MGRIESRGGVAVCLSAMVLSCFLVEVTNAQFGTAYFIAPGPSQYYYAPATVTPAQYYFPTAPTIPGYNVQPAVYYYPAPAPTPTPAPGPVAPAIYSPPFTSPAYYYYTAPVVSPTVPPPPGYPVAPTTYYYSSSPQPTYYYVAPVAAVVPVAPVIPSPPTVCPVCPTCASPTAGRRLSQATVDPNPAPTPKPTTTAAATILPNTPARRPAGTCYCPYDTEWRSWPISLQTCRSSLYTRCAADERLKCSWLDSYFNPAADTSFVKVHEKEISDYLYQDCPPSAPCACSNLQFDKKDSTNDIFACCRDLSIWAMVPHSGLTTKDVDMFCKSGRSERVAQWVKHALWHQQCDSAQPVYHSFKALTAAPAAPVAATVAATQQQAAAPAPAAAPQSGLSPAVVGTLVGVCAFVAVLGGILGYHAAAVAAGRN